MRFAAAGDELDYEAAGAGPLLLHAHGLFSSRLAEDRLGFFDWTRLGADRRMVRYDARGHGRSTGHPNAGDYTWRCLGDDFAALAMLLSGDAPVIGMGVSMGAAAAIWAASATPARFTRLVIVAPPVAGGERAAAAGAYRALADACEDAGMAAALTMLRQAARPPLFAELAEYPPTPDVAEALLPAVLRGAAASDLPPDAALARITCPTLILSWEGDPGHPLTAAQRLAALLPAATVETARTLAGVRDWSARIEAFLRG